MTKMTPHNIIPPEIADLTPMSPLELNAVKFNQRHTLLSPDVLEKKDD